MKKWKLHKEDYDAMKKLREKINKSNIRDIDMSDWFDDIPEKVFQEWEFIGLNNCDFIEGDIPNNKSMSFNKE